MVSFIFVPYLVRQLDSLFNRLRKVFDQFILLTDCVGTVKFDLLDHRMRALDVKFDCFDNWIPGWLLLLEI